MRGVKQQRARGANGADPAAQPSLAEVPQVEVEKHVNGAVPSARGHSLPREIAVLPSADRRDDLRIIEARLFASADPLSEAEMSSVVSEGADIASLITELKAFYAGRGINLVQVAGKWAFRTASDLAFVLEKHTVEERRLSKAALETLAIIAYHQPVTRAEIEEIRGVTASKGTLDVLLETGWVRPRGRRRAPGKPITYGTTDSFLSHFGLSELGELPGLAELKGAGLLDATLPPDFTMPKPQDVASLMPDELPLELPEEEDDADPDAGPLEGLDAEGDDPRTPTSRRRGRSRTGGRREGKSA